MMVKMMKGGYTAITFTTAFIRSVAEEPMAIVVSSYGGGRNHDGVNGPRNRCRFALSLLMSSVVATTEITRRKV